MQDGSMDRLTPKLIGCGLRLDTALPLEERWKTLSQQPAVAWFTGLSGAGKSTIANVVDRCLVRNGRHTMVIDGDNLRKGLSSDLGFSDIDRTENIRRAAEAARLMAEAGLIVIVAMISPLRKDRAMARTILEGFLFMEIFIDTPLEICEARDTKGLYKLARAGDIKDFTGISSAYEAPNQPNIIAHTQNRTIEESAAQIIDALMCATTPRLRDANFDT